MHGEPSCWLPDYLWATRVKKKSLMNSRLSVLPRHKALFKAMEGSSFILKVGHPSSWPFARILHNRYKLSITIFGDLALKTMKWRTDRFMGGWESLCQQKKRGSHGQSQNLWAIFLSLHKHTEWSYERHLSSFPCYQPNLMKAP